MCVIVVAEEQVQSTNLPSLLDSICPHFQVNSPVCSENTKTTHILLKVIYNVSQFCSTRDHAWSHDQFLKAFSLCLFSVSDRDDSLISLTHTYTVHVVITEMNLEVIFIGVFMWMWIFQINLRSAYSFHVPYFILSVSCSVGFSLVLVLTRP